MCYSTSRRNIYSETPTPTKNELAEENLVSLSKIEVSSKLVEEYSPHILEQGNTIGHRICTFHTNHRMVACVVVAGIAFEYLRSISVFAALLNILDPEPSLRRLSSIYFPG
jgi:hypothetical protein